MLLSPLGLINHKVSSENLLGLLTRVVTGGARHVTWMKWVDLEMGPLFLFLKACKRGCAWAAGLKRSCSLLYAYESCLGCLITEIEIVHVLMIIREMGVGA